MRTIIFFAFITILLVCSSFQVQPENLETGWYFLSENQQNGISFEDVNSHENFTVDKMPIVNVNDFKNVKLKDEKMFGMKLKKLKITLTTEGNKKWNLATDEMSKKYKSAVFIFENEVFCHLTIIQKRNEVSPSIVDDNVNSNKLKKIYDSMPENLKK